MKRLTIAVIILTAIMLHTSYGQDSQHISHVKWLYSFWDNPQQVELQGDYAYLATDRSGMQILDISDPTSISLVCHMPDISITELVIENQIAYTVRSQGNDLAIFDITNPTTPDLCFYRRVSDWIWIEMTAGGGWMFFTNIVENEWGDEIYLNIFTLADPRNPRGSSRQFSISHCIHNNSDLYFHTSRNNLEGVGFYRLPGFEFIGIHDWIHPVDLSSIDNHLLALTATNNLQIINITDPENPELESEIELEGERPVLFDHDMQTVAALSDGSTLNLIDIQETENPALINSFRFERPMIDVDISGSIGGVLVDPFDFQTFRWSEDGIEILDSLSGRGRATDVKIDGDIGYMCCSESGFKKMDLSDPENPEELAVWDIDNSSCKIYNDIAFVTALDTLIYMIDLNDEENPPQELSVESRVIDLDYEDGLIYLLLEYGGENPGRLIIRNALDFEEQIGEFYLPRNSKTHTIEYDNGIVYIGQSGLFRIIDVHNPEEPEQVAEVQTRGFVCDIVASGDNLYVADTPDPRNRDYFPSVWWFNIEIPTSPQYMGCYLSEASYSIRSIKIQDGFLYMLGQNLSSRQPRIEVVHITNPRQMSLLGWQNIPQGGLNFDVSGEYIYVANNWNFDIYDCSQSLNVEMHQERVVDDFTVLETYPNPFNSTVKIEFSLAYDQFVGGVILDINGRQVADLSSSGIMQRGKNTLTWDADGYPSGIYLIKVNLNGITKVNQIVLQK